MQKIMFRPQGFWGAFGLVLLLLLVNQWQIFSLAAATGMKMMPINFSFGQTVRLTGDLAKDAAKVILLTGVPKVYGAGLGVSYIHPSQVNDMNQMIAAMSKYDPDYGSSPIQLEGDPLQRYIDIGLRIACEYCCGAKALITQTGKAACGCAHSQAMRGLSAYLLQNHGSEFTNDQILQELARWKGLYFPKQMMQKYMEQVQSGEYTPDMAALVMGLKIKASSGQATPLPSDLDLPNMAGGC